MEKRLQDRKRLPGWLKMKRAGEQEYSRIRNLVERQHLHTICKSGNCPNIGECWNRGTATFMILGNICTRCCKFCAVPTGKPHPVDHEEPYRLAHTIKTMGIRHCIITSVDRDDLDDLGASAWAATMRSIKEVNPDVTMEVLIPDFQGRREHIQKIIAESPEIVSHNLETVERLTPGIRSCARYKTSLDVLKYMTSPGITKKSGIMLGLGETMEEVLQTMDDLIEAGVQVMTLGQYLQPTPLHIPVDKYVPPEIFEKYKEIGLQKGFAMVESSPLVRSSYYSEKHVMVSDFKKQHI